LILTSPSDSSDKDNVYNAAGPEELNLRINIKLSLTQWIFEDIMAHIKFEMKQ